MFIRNDMNVSYMRFFNASPDAPQVDIYINGGLTFKNIPFKGFSEYVQIPMGDYKIEVFTAGDKGSPVLTQNINVPKKEVITLTALGNFEDLQLVSYTEGNSEDLPEDESKIRFIHLSPDAPKVEVLIDGNLVFDDVGFMDATDYEQLPSSTYNIIVNLADTNDTIMSLKPELKSQKVYTIYIIGNPPDLSSIQSLDGITFVRFE